MIDSDNIHLLPNEIATYDNERDIRSRLPPWLGHNLILRGKAWGFYPIRVGPMAEQPPLRIAHLPVVIQPFVWRTSPFPFQGMTRPSDPMPHLDPTKPLPDEALLELVRWYPRATAYLKLFTAELIVLMEDEEDCLNRHPIAPEYFGGMQVFLSYGHGPAISSSPAATLGRRGQASGVMWGVGLGAKPLTPHSPASHIQPEATEHTSPPEVPTILVPGDQIGFLGPRFGQEIPGFSGDRKKQQEATLFHTYLSMNARAGLLVRTSDGVKLTTVSHVWGENIEHIERGIEAYAAKEVAPKMSTVRFYTNVDDPHALIEGTSIPHNVSFLVPDT